MKIEIKSEQARAELCQAQLQLSYSVFSKIVFLVQIVNIVTLDIIIWSYLYI